MTSKEPRPRAITLPPGGVRAGGNGPRERIELPPGCVYEKSGVIVVGTGPRLRRPVNKDRYTAVAQTCAKAKCDGVAYIAALRDRFPGRSDALYYRWIERARKYGFMPPAS